MSKDTLDDAFLEAWNRTGDLYLTRNQIAELFGFSSGWVQIMIIKTGAEPRRISRINQFRVRFGLDMRAITRQKNVVRYQIRKYIQDLYEARSDVGLFELGTTDYLQALKRNNRAERGLMRNYGRLKKLSPNDFLLTDAEYWLNEKA